MGGCTNALIMLALFTNSFLSKATENKEIKFNVKQNVHRNCRNKVYPYTNLTRTFVPDDKVWWNVSWSDYKPLFCSKKAYNNRVHTDPVCINSVHFYPQWNTVHRKVNRKSSLGMYRVVNNYPINPMGRTGITGRGILDRWGPNHQVVLVITRWKVNKLNKPIFDARNGLPVLEVIGVKSRLRETWSLPTTVVYPGAKTFDVMRRLYYRELAHLDVVNVGDEELECIKEGVKDFFTNRGEFVYSGYIDDYRNTDNAWVESKVVRYHAYFDDYVSQIPLKGESGTGINKWREVKPNETWVSRHSEFVNRIVAPAFLTRQFTTI